MKSSPLAVFVLCFRSVMSLLAVAAAGAARAADISFSDTTGRLATDWSAPLSVAQFDPSLGTLTQVQLRLDGTSIVSVAAENLSATPRTFAFTETVGLTVDGLGLSPLLSLSLVNGDHRDLGAFDGGLDFAGPSGFTWDEIQTDGSIAKIWTSGLGAFIGTTSLDFLASAGATGEFSSPPGVISSQSADARATVTAIYTYVPAAVPDPLSTAGALAAALGMLGLFRRRLA